MLKSWPKNREHGFTLIELMIGFVLIGILMAMAMPSYQAWIQNTRIRSTAESIQNGLQLARMEAVRRNTNIQFVLGAGSSWTVGCVTVTAACPATIQSRATGEGSSSAILVTNSDGTTIQFNNFGSKLSPAGAMAQFDVDVSTAVLPASKSRELRITVDAGGNTRMCDPDPGVATTDPRRCP